MSPEGYQLSEGRYLQERNYNSIADALNLTGTVVPNGKVWTILSAGYYPSVAETRIVQFSIFAKTTMPYPIAVPVSVAVAPTYPFPCVTEGMEIKLFPGESIRVDRSAATAGSTMQLWVRFIEADLPFYTYQEPLKMVSQNVRRHGSSFRAAGGGGVVVGGGGGGGHDLPGGGGGGGAEPV